MSAVPAQDAATPAAAVGTHAVLVLIEDRLITLNRAVGLVRRRNLPVKSVSVGPAAAPGLSRLTIMIESDDASAARAAQHMEKIVGVRETVTFNARDGVTRELALIKVRARPDRYAELLDVVQLYNAAVVDDTPAALVVEVTGSEAFVLSCLRALERFEVLDVARSGVVALAVHSSSAGTL